MSKRRPILSPPRTVPVGQMRRNLEAVQRFRLNVVIGALLILFAGLLGRLAKLQLVDAAAYSAAASHRHDRNHAFAGMRGRILDVHGRTLVTSHRVLSIAVDPLSVDDVDAFARRLAAFLDDEGEARRIRAAIASTRPFCRHRILYPCVEDERVVGQLSHFAGNFPATIRAGLRGLKVSEHERRTYLNGHYAAHVLGRAPHNDVEGNLGGEGVEGAFHEALKAGSVVVPLQRDGGRRRRCRAALAVDTSPAAGRDVRLTLDIVVQHSVESALDRLDADWQPVWAVGIVLDPSNGHVLALSNRPTFDPAAPVGEYNHAVQGLSPPGSIFKPFTAAFALGMGVVDPEERVELPRRKVFAWRRGTRAVNDSHDAGEFDGRGTVVRLIAHSSNTGAAELLWRVMGLGREPGERSLAPLRNLFARLGFDALTGIQLRWDKVAYYGDGRHKWNPLHPGIGCAFGQGFSISPLRLASCFAAFARADARVVRPTLLPGRGGPRADLPPVCRTPAHLALVREGLRRCVQEGTGRWAFEGCEIPVAGKTGTAQFPGTPYDAAGFAGYAPADRPRVLVLVMAKVDEKRVHPTSGVKPYGGNVAGPAVRSVIEQTLAYLDERDGGVPCEGLR